MGNVEMRGMPGIFPFKTHCTDVANQYYSNLSGKVYAISQRSSLFLHFLFCKVEIFWRKHQTISLLHLSVNVFSYVFYLLL